MFYAYYKDDSNIIRYVAGESRYHARKNLINTFALCRSDKRHMLYRITTTTQAKFNQLMQD